MSSDRRSFLSGLASLPLIGGGIALIGKPTAAAVPVTDALFDRYLSWIAHEHAELLVEREQRRNRSDPNEAQFAALYAGHRRGWARELFRCPDDPLVDRLVTVASSSARAAVVLSAAGVPIAGGA